jgi:antirestriction protein ArdC
MAPLSEEGSAVPNALPEDNYEYAGEKFPPTAEQRNVVTAIMTGDNVVVRALAGTGKTSTLTLAARRLLEEQPKKKIVYIAFNKTVQMEAEGKMPKNVESRTGDSIAFQGVSNDIRQKFLNQKGKTANMKLRAEDIADELGIKPTGVKLKGVEVSLSSREIPAIIKQAVNNFSISADDELGAKHFTEELDEVPRSFVEYANAYWDDLNSPAGVFGINNAHITKIWALSNPDLGSIGSGMKTPADVIFFDEAQDINPVIAKVIADQTIQKVYVGDGNQAIYAFRGAEDQLDRTTAKWDLPLTQSFRFGPEIAGMANRFLTQLDSKYRVEGSGSKGEVVDGMEDPDVVITRTNSGGFRAMIELLDAGKVVGITKGTKDELESLVLSASWLIGDQTKFKKPTMHPDLAEFKNWSEVKEAVEKGEGRKVKALYDLVVQNGIGSIKDILSRVKVATPESEKKDLKPSSDFKKITLDQAEDGAKGSIGEGINYEVKDKAIRLSGNGTFKGKDKIKDQNFRWDATGKQWFKEVEDDLDRQKAINDLRRGVGGFAPDAGEEEDEIDVIVTTAHKSKGLQWNNVRIFDDFWGPRTNKKTGELEMPVDEELRLAYVALTRAQKKLDPGPLNWIKEYTEDEDESPKKPTAVETAMGMALPTEKVTEDEFNESTVKTAEKIDPAVEKVANAIIEAIERGTVPWQKPWTGGGFLPTSVATGKTYEGSNILVLWAAMEKNGWTDNRFLTYNKAEKLGGNIRRGEKGTQVIHWPQIFKEVEKPDGTKEKVRVYQPPKIRTVFNVEQAENIDLPAIVKGEPIPITEGETAILEAYKDKPEILFVAQDQAFYSPIDDIIKLPQREQFKSEQSFFETLVHELAHSTGHRSRLDRTELLDNYGKHLESRGEEELIAEITVALVAGRLGVKIDFENVAAYAKSWLQAVKNNPQMIVKAAKQAQRAVDHMLGKQEEPEGPVDEDGNPIGSGVGSEGKTGEEIAAEKKAEPENKDERTV